MSPPIPFPLKFVLPWYGEDVAGGAETMARLWARELARRGCEIEVLTTCAEAVYSNWNRNHHRAGPAPGASVAPGGGAPVRRFPVRRGDRRRYDELNRRLLLGDRLSRAEEQAFIAESIRSDALEAYIRDCPADAVFVFMPYLYGTTILGARIRPQRSFLLPCLHDECYASLGVIAEALGAARGLIFNSEAEAAFARDRFGLGGKPSVALGLGIDPNVSPDAGRFRRATGIAGDFICYFGRRDETKNTPALIEFFCRYVERTGRQLSLALGGRGGFEAPARHRARAGARIHDLGFVSEELKYDACAAALALCQPSNRESLSIALLEAWLCGAPALVSGFCDVTREQCLSANGGLFFRNYPEFAECLDYLIEHPRARAALGENGRSYVLEHCQWDKLVERLSSFLKATLDS